MADELPAALRAYRTREKTSTEETPFSLAFGVEATKPAEILCFSARANGLDIGDNEQKMRGDLDLLEEKREEANRKTETYQRRIARYYDRRVRPRRLEKGDLVLRKVTINTRRLEDRVLGPNWEGPCRVEAELQLGTYKLATSDGKLIKHTRNLEHLKKYYQ